MTFTNLPVQLTIFIGRENDLAEVERMVSTSRLVTLTGAGRCGKTRLAIQTASQIRDTFEDGVWLVDFVPLHQPGLIPQHMAQTFGLRPAPDQPLNEILLSFVKSKQMLLILDNCEHLLAACSELAQQLLGAATRLNVLVTSRQPLAMAGERIYLVQGLEWPSLDPATFRNPEDLMQYDSFHLFVERARAI
jgi:predicted ATPase